MKRQRSEPSPNATVKERLQFLVDGSLPPILPFESLAEGDLNLEEMRGGCIPPTSYPIPLLIEGLDYAGEGHDPKITFEGRLLGESAQESLKIRHYMRSNGYAYAVRFSDGLLLYQESRTALGRHFNGVTSVTVTDENTARIAGDYLIELLMGTPNVTRNVFNTAMTTYGLIAHLGATTLPTMLSELEALRGMDQQHRLERIKVLNQDSRAGRGLSRIYTNLLGLSVPSVSMDELFKHGEGLTSNLFAELLTLHPSWALPIRPPRKGFYCGADGQRKDTRLLSDLQDTDVVQCISTYLHVNAVTAVLLNTDVYAGSDPIFTTVKKGKGTIIGKKIDTVPISAKLLKILAAKNVSAHPAGVPQPDRGGSSNSEVSTPMEVLEVDL